MSGLDEPLGELPVDVGMGGAGAEIGGGGAGSGRGVLVEFAFLLLLRGIYIMVSRHYVNISLFTDLRSVIHEDSPSSDSDSPDDLKDVQLDDAEQGIFASSSTSPTRAAPRARSNSGSNLGAGEAGVPLLSPHKPPMRRNSTDTKGAVRQQNVLYPKLSSSLFCLAFSECTMLFTLVLFGEAVSERSRTLHWSISLITILALIIFIIPLGLCLLLTHRTRSAPAPRTLFLTLIPFSVYVFLFYRVGSWIASKVVVEGSHSLGFINALLARVCAPGVILIASLSGGGAVSTAWQAFEWRSISSAEPVTDGQIIAAERSLYRARMDIQQRTRSLALATASANREAEETASRSLLARWTSSTPAAAHLASLQVELSALENMEALMVKDVAILRRRKAIRELGRSFRGRMWLAAGWALSVYCVWRVFIACVNLIFGYSQRHHHNSIPQPHDPDDPNPPPTPAGTDLITSLLAKVALVLNIEIDIAAWSRLLGLLLIGGIILANMRNVLGSVSRIFKATSTGVSASFMLLFLAELMSLYLLTSLISLPSSPSESSEALLDTLPDFNVFSRLFDSVFLVTATGVFVIRWIERKVRFEDVVTSQYS
ncbi:G protein-coupled receptor 89A [Pseudohyphozyma bogoriensis]|nr:G protein-coupled receptor 89A [Pseudohyphozyma bogoriensis]